MEKGKAANNNAGLNGLQELIDYDFKDPELLLRALTHSSYANERAEEGIRDNERLEFLGDAVLGLVISDWLFHSGRESEGRLTRAKSHFVSARYIQRCARYYRLGEFLRLGRGEEKDGGRRKSSLLANAFEALVGAIYLDGGMEAAQSFLHEAFRDSLESMDDEWLLREDHKSYLQELVQAEDLPAPSYTIVDTRGPEHSKEFTVELMIGDRSLARGRGRSRKSAEQDAARAALTLIESDELSLATMLDSKKSKGNKNRP